jgi:hypothetical protein
MLLWVDNVAINAGSNPSCSVALREASASRLRKSSNGEVSQDATLSPRIGRLIDVIS